MNVPHAEELQNSKYGSKNSNGLQCQAQAQAPSEIPCNCG
uniref:Uncharacterized protein n=1 Tax=Rhizophora mucronata TaxID=61149 RepID=A0A2P2IIV0_RHIMU